MYPETEAYPATRRIVDLLTVSLTDLVLIQGFFVFEHPLLRALDVIALYLVSRSFLDTMSARTRK